MNNLPIVLDTSAWMTWVRKSCLEKPPHADFPELSHCVMPTIVLCDVAAWSLQNLAECEHDELMAKIEVCECCEIDQATARAAATLPIGLPGVRTSDELSYALARLRGLQMLTCNPLLEGLPNVIYRGPALILAQSEDRVH